MATGKEASVDALDLFAALESLPTSLPILPPFAASDDSKVSDSTENHATPGSSHGTNDRGKRDASISTAGAVHPPKTTQDYNNLYMQCSAAGQRLKHSADGNLKLNPPAGSEAAQISLLEHADALILYIYAFWCRDYALAKADSTGNIVPIIHLESWQTSSAFLKFVKSRAIQMDWHFLVAICNLSEAMILNRMAIAERKEVSRAMRGSSDAEGQDTGASTKMQEFLTRSAGGDYVSHRFSQGMSYLSPHNLSTRFPQTWRACVEDNMKVRAEEWMVLVRPFMFSWPPQLASFGHLVGFAKSLLEEWAEQRGLAWTSWTVGNSAANRHRPSGNHASPSSSSSAT